MFELNSLSQVFLHMEEGALLSSTYYITAVVIQKYSILQYTPHFLYLVKIGRV